LQARTLKSKDALASSLFRGRWVPVGNVKIAEHQHIHLRAQEARDGILGALHDRLLQIEARVEKTGTPVSSANFSMTP
jgi:hypothetical protein